eukprot:CAMPEP_0168456944 /NCGR_PEP_ID=MMETSP0228-20121227/51568_1 /TAXON_ID=133427 /ORGANISM="Protoceratium reticulatum, Strain CCCM 535 (=CCMP 1889)" /LENGTH=58 /DNA_ID=CAMNT_0008471919 /DNA_START=1 /DNA_END=174 /DNA_ORIENTATION=-
MAEQCRYSQRGAADAVGEELQEKARATRPDAVGQRTGNCNLQPELPDRRLAAALDVIA